ncbi:16S rRNA (cytosine(1402)-N(4))-methyltransferase RsmH [Dysgonomonas sp. Marseille-Q5470]|uniref:16S rRNA (cytosine(1402)-N(4))-methyltransferase RsmH n=1 Tax=Dysgonomonas sp. Marseille-Q5470 TaxID=3039494 RepID=UPI0024BC2544|nr:16S rRNA (cytosine(1402)-N(4))-methyltransferase RsmH [Dysgonomonas sp. Marseille-Q5470]|eukprot:TRINITY_DN25427_c0_g1_i1.p1 TRINITY_DN25427_c0_g1~~TRINITY_DN25427_c0_g1_i1.p1  ORF type:complete len:304 (-),score=9.06 TRINITY_DN25427_c0_g1_i1:723-1634(-)
MADAYHIPVLLHESIDGMNLHPDSICVDVTFGGGGHSREILSRLGDKGHLYAFDQDEDAINNIEASSKFTFIRSNFRYLKNFIKYHKVDGVDAILADLGVSSHHFDAEDRGFSFRFEDSDLDMRMNRKGGKTAAQILNTYTEEKLADVFYLYGELKQSRRIASVIVKTRKEKPYKKTSDLLATLNSFVGRGEKEKKILAQAFQALRIEVNEEMEVLKEMLEQALDILKPGGRLSVITYHSLEDRIVKNFFKTGNFEGKVEKDFFGNFETPFKLINNKVITPSKDEEERNPRSRSAKLRVAEKV